MSDREKRTQRIEKRIGRLQSAGSYLQGLNAIERGYPVILMV